MKFKEYQDKRNELMAAAEQALSENRLDDAKKAKEDIEKLDAEFEAAKQAASDLEALKQNVVVPPVLQNNTVTRKDGHMENQADQKKMDELYKSAWLKKLAVRRETGEKLFGDLTPDEQDAMTTTSSSGAIVPKEILNQIEELVESMAPLYDDATKTALTKGFSLPRHKKITKGDAKETGEGIANDDEENEFDAIDLTGVEIKKHIEITRKMQFQSIDAFQAWVVQEQADRIAAAKEKHIYARLDNETTGIAKDHVLAEQDATDETVRKVFGLIKKQGIRKVYANNSTIWNRLAGIKDETGKPMFLGSTVNDDPRVQGRLYGAEVRQDETVEDNVAYFGIPASVLANDFDKLSMSNQMDPKTFATVVGSYSLFDAGLKNPEAFVKVTFKAGE